ncbi:MAG TPA: hypothetical protein VH475_07160 [Tepidisphaeraceae bacterium]|jgi:hypothetical protein
MSEMASSETQTPEERATRPLWKTVLAFLAGVLAVHALVMLFHLALMAQWPPARPLRTIYYSKHGVKETWPLFDYYIPIGLLVMLTAAVFQRRSLWMHVAGWVVCWVTILGTLPIYSTRLVPTPVSAWKNPAPHPFDRPPDQFPTLLAAGIFSVITRYAMATDSNGTSSQKP